VGATSALREAKNHKQLIQQVRDKSGLQIILIDGEREAMLIHKAVAHELKIKSGKNLLLDIGGGSCEFVLSEGDRYINYVSLKAGAIRLVNDINTSKPYLSRDYLESIIQTYIDDLGDFKDFIKQPDHGFIATGGNARSLNKLSRIIFNHSNRAFITQNQMEMLVAIVFGFSHDDRISKLDLRADRVDVMLPASLLILKTMQTFGFDKVLTPKIGLRHGMLLELLVNFSEQRR
jgi:exopolyphosphatase/guanosine-5'-triphosphate,3'-diphosphate pyrophosphatase